MKSKSKKVTFVIQDHWSGNVHYVERRLDVSQELKPEGVSFSANQEAAYHVFEEMKDDYGLARKLKLQPLSSNGLFFLDVDISLISVLIASSGSIRPVQLTFESSDITKRRIARNA